MTHILQTPDTDVPLAEGGRRVVVSIFVLVVVFILGITQLVRFDYNRTVREAEDQLAFSAELYEQTVEASFAIANMQMWNMIDRLAITPFEKNDVIENRYGSRMRDTLRDIEQVDSLVLINPEGNVAWSSIEALMGQHLGDRAYFQAALKLGRNQYAVGVPLIARGSGRRLTPIAWPVVSPNGRARGVIVSSLGEDYFSDLLNLTDIPTDMHVRIQAADGEVAFQSNDMTRDAEDVIISASRNLPTLGLVIEVSRSKTAVMTGLYQRTAIFLLIATILFATTIGMALRLNAKSIQLAKGLHRSKQDNVRIVAAQREFNTIFENVGDGIIIFTQDGKFRRTNKMAREIMGQVDNAATVTLLQTLLPEFSEMNADFAAVRIKTTDDQVVQCRVMKLTLYDQEVAYCVLTDVTAEERLLTARDHFITSINHELRTPLTSLAGSLELLEDRFSADFSGPAERLVKMAARNADRLLVLVNDILTLQAIDQGQFHLRAKPVSVSAALEEAVSINSGYGLAAKVGVVSEHSEPGQVFVDPDRLQQIFSNLISNAVKYSPKGGDVKIGARETDQEITFYVRDAGPGIPISGRARLFDRFTAPVHNKGVQAGGTGLGLAITKQLVERQGGSIWFETQTTDGEAAETGTTFFVKFKLHTPPETMLETAK